MKHTNHTFHRAIALLLTLALLLPLLAIGSFAADPETVKLTADSSEAITIDAGENKILDIAGHNLTGVVTNKGTLTVTDSVGGGKIGFTTGANDIQAAIVNEGTLIYDGAAIELIGTGGLTQAVGIYNKPGATMSMKSGTIEAITNGTYWSYSILNEGTITEISGGTIRAIKNNTTSGANIMCINNRNNGVVKLISGGEFYAYSKANNGSAIVLRNQGSAKLEKVTGGNLLAEVDGTGGSDAIGIRNENGSVGEIAGGTITATTKGGHADSWVYALYNCSNQTVDKISGGILTARAEGTGSGAKSFAIVNETNGTIKEIAGGTITGYTSAGEWTFGIDNRAGATINKISGGTINAIIDHTLNAPNGIAIANLGRIDEITDGTFYAETRSNGYADNRGSAMALRNNNANAYVGKITGGTFYARALSGDHCLAFGISNQAGSIGEIGGDVLIYGHTNASAWAFGINNTATINTISGGTVVGRIERTAAGANTIAINNEANGVINNLTGGVFYAYHHSSGGAFAVRNRGKMPNISGGAFYNNMTNNDTILTENGTTAYASGYSLSDPLNGKASSESGYKYVVPTGATVDEAYVDGEELKIATVTNAGNKVAEYKLYGTALYVASVNNAPYTSVEKAATAAGEGDTVTLIADVTNALLPKDTSVILDLAGYSISNLTVEGTATVTDSVGTGSVNAITNKGALTIENGNYTGVTATSEITVIGGWFTGDITGDLTVSGGAFAKALPESATIADGYTLTEVTDNNWAYVIPTGGSAVELCDETGLLSVRIFDKDGNLTATYGSVDTDKLLAGWSVELGGVPTIADDKVTAEHSPLYAVWAEKPLYYFLGSSVTYGSATGGRSFVEEIAVLYPIAYNKQAISGTTLVDNGANSYVQRLVSKFDPNVAPERLIVQLSTNDASQNKPLGTVSASKNSADFDKTTIIGAMEFIIAYAKETWDAPVAFYTNPNYNNATYEKMIDALYDLQEKWGIQIIDFYYYVDMEELSSATLSSYMADAIHPNVNGYKWMAGVMGEALLAVDCDHQGAQHTTAPTCDEQGHVKVDCVICGKTNVTIEELDATGHDYKDGECAVCGEEDPDYKDPNQETKPPKTGDVLIIVSILAVIATASVALLSKKRRIN